MLFEPKKTKILNKKAKNFPDKSPPAAAPIKNTQERNCFSQRKLNEKTENVKAGSLLHQLFHICLCCMSARLQTYIITHHMMLHYKLECCKGLQCSMC